MRGSMGYDCMIGQVSHTWQIHYDWMITLNGLAARGYLTSQWYACAGGITPLIKLAHLCEAFGVIHMFSTQHI